MIKLTYLLATASVALVVLVDIATGQGPPQLQSYLAAAPIQFGLPPRAVIEPGMNPYQAKPQFDSQYKLPFDKEDSSKFSETKIQGVSEKEYEKNLNKGEDGYENAGYQESANPPEPKPEGGMFSSFSNAWKTLTSLGRRTKRGTNDALGASGSPFSSGAISGVPGAEWSQTNNQGYIYFKIPKNSICYN